MFSLIPLLNLLKDILNYLFGLFERVQFNGSNLLLVLICFFCGMWGIRILFGFFGGSTHDNNN